MEYEVWQSCLLVPGLSRSECASRVQAWGSIAAIVAAVWVAHRATKTSQELAKDQAEQMHRTYERARVERHLEQIGPVLELFDGAIAELEHVRLFAMTADLREEWAVDPAKLDQLKLVQKALDEIQVHSMPTAATAGCLLNGRVLLGTAASALQEMMNKVGLASHPTAEEDAAFQELVRLIQQERERMRQALTRLLSPANAAESVMPSDGPRGI
jgi:hypothetical protein